MLTTSGTWEAGCIALSEAVNGVIFLRKVQDFMEAPMRIVAVNAFEDNEGGTKLTVNIHATRRTKHIDVRHDLGRDACDPGKCMSGRKISSTRTCSLSR